ncbi:hypothetical protein GR157_14405 [Burkholderia sp. 4701]|nr:hypothetical protein [Burkholderia sp. 4701]MXN82673.1 hypothetical protein [Burkholderia sp. 4812]
MKVSELGEIALLREIILKSVNQTGEDAGDDCAHIEVAGREMLWSIDPCPTPAARWFGLDSPEVYGWYTALINLSDIAASGGTPLGMLVSLEFPDETTVEFVEGFQQGLKFALDKYGVKLFGGNVKSAPKFSATGSILGLVDGRRSPRRRIDEPEVAAYLVGPIGYFWTSIVAHHMGDADALAAFGGDLRKALCYPEPQVSAGRALGELPYDIACMDCSDGVLNALHQLAVASSLDLTLVEGLVERIPSSFKAILLRHGFNPENAIFQFGDWQLLCFVARKHAGNFEERMAEFSVTYLGEARAGSGCVSSAKGQVANRAMLNENFVGGYNSIAAIDDLIDRFMMAPIFDGKA